MLIWNGAASFLGLPLFSMYGGQFVKQQLVSHPQSPKKHTSLPPCQEFPGYNLEPAPGTQRGRREQRKRQAPPAEYAADLISKGNIYTGFVWGRSRRSRSRHLPSRSLTFTQREGLTGFSQERLPVFSALRHCLKALSLEKRLGAGKASGTQTSRTGLRSKEPLMDCLMGKLSHTCSG